MALYLKGDKEAAIVEYEKAAVLGDDPEILVLLGRAYGETGRMDKAREILKQLEKTAQDTYLRNYLFALLYIGLGEKDKAMESMESAAGNHENYDTNWMKLTPCSIRCAMIRASSGCKPGCFTKTLNEPARAFA